MRRLGGAIHNGADMQGSVLYQVNDFAIPGSAQVHVIGHVGGLRLRTPIISVDI